MNYRKLIRFAPYLLAVFAMASCAGLNRSCSQACACAVGGDYVVVELTEHGGVPYRCWALRDVSIQNENGSDGIYWKDSKSGNLVHISGSYDYVKVESGNWAQAYDYLGLTEATCAQIRNRRFNLSTNRYE